MTPVLLFVERGLQRGDDLLGARIRTGAMMPFNSTIAVYFLPATSADFQSTAITRNTVT